MWMEGKGRVLSEARVGMGRGGGDEGQWGVRYLPDLGPLHPSGHPDPQSSSQVGP